MSGTAARPEAASTEQSAPAALRVEDLHIDFDTAAGPARAVNGVSWSVGRGQTLAILGESGSGKSVTAQAVMGILPTPPAHIRSGRILLHGEDVLAMSDAERRATRGESIAMVFQDALSALNPVFPVGWQIAELFTTKRGTSRREARRRAVELLDRVRIPAAADRFSDYPHQFSGGMRQRAMIAMAIALDPDVLIADEPTTALDVTVQAQVMSLLAELQRELEMGLVLITHDLGVVAQVADEISVMYAGRVVEHGPAADVYRRPAHPYTRGLLQSVPRLRDRGGELHAIKGSPPTVTDLPPGCAFHPRCVLADADACRRDEPAARPVAADRWSACHHFEEIFHA